MKVVCLPGDCIGPEIMVEAKPALHVLALEIELEDHLVGAAAIRATGKPLPNETLEACRLATGILKAPIERGPQVDVDVQLCSERQEALLRLDVGSLE